MPIDFSTLTNPATNRLLIEAKLKPLQGTRFQPTGFPDLGPALFDAPDGGQALLVESNQSVANRLEATLWDPAAQELIQEAKGLSYVRVTKKGGYLTSSITEAHRLNSPYILEGKEGSLLEELKKKTEPFSEGPIDRTKLGKVVAEYDVNALLHGLFLAKKELAGGRLRIERALSGFIEATGVQVAASGGVKNDQVDPSGNSKHGFGNVPFQRDEFTAKDITAYFNLDLKQLRAYGLGPEGERLLIGLALFKVAAFLEGDLRLRTACDLEKKEVLVKRPEGFKLPSAAELRQALPELIKAAKPLMGQGARTLEYVEDEKKKKKDATEDDE